LQDFAESVQVAKKAQSALSSHCVQHKKIVQAEFKFECSFTHIVPMYKRRDITLCLFRMNPDLARLSWYCGPAPLIFPPGTWSNGTGSSDDANEQTLCFDCRSLPDRGAAVEAVAQRRRAAFDSRPFFRFFIGILHDRGPDVESPHSS
jgi:hypothetical protein